MKKRDIWISDLTHTAQGITSHTFPLGVSLVYSYAKQELGKEFNFKLFKFPSQLSDAMNEKSPAMLCFSNFSWNLELGYKFAHLAKLKNPNVVTVFGGPNFPTEQAEKLDFLKKRPAIDFYVELEGELAFVDIVNNLTSNNFDVSFLKKNEIKIINTSYLYNDRLVSGKIERIKDINIVPSPYLTGALDDFFNYPLVPILETTRGCPFSCTFCADGLSSKNKIMRYNPERTKEELHYIAKNVKNMNELIISDLNFGMYKHDLETAKMIADVQKNYNYPTMIDTPAGKNMPDRTIEVANTMKGWMMGGAMQSTDAEVLAAIKRSNISISAYKKLIDFGNKRGRTYSETILGLPKDSKEKHFESLRFNIDSNVNSLHMHSAMLLSGTEMASNACREKYGLKTKFRTLPGNVGKYNILGEQHSLAEIEEIIVGSNSLSGEDYVECRVMNLIIKSFYNNSIFNEVYAMLRKINVSPFDCLIYIKNHPELYTKKISEIFQSFITETTEDLFNSWEEANNYVLSKDKIDNYIKGKVGTNELTLHTALLLSEFKDICDLVFKSVENVLFEKKLYTKEIKNYLHDLKEFTLMCKKDLLDIKKVKSASFKYDFEAISKAEYSINPNNIPEEKNPFNFEFFHNDEQQEYISNSVKLYAGHSRGIGMVYARSNMKQMYRSFSKST